MRRLISLLITALPLAAGCGGDDDSGALDPIVCPEPVAATDPCAGRTCFDACGAPIAIDDAPFAGGFGLAVAPEQRPYVANRVGQTLVTANALGVEVRHGETGALLGAAPLGGVPTAIADAGSLAFVGTATGVIYPIVVNDPTHPVVVASWRPTAEISVLTADNGRLVLITPAGVSLIDVTDPAAPTEAQCLVVPAAGGMERVWQVTANANFVVATGGDTPRAFIYDLLRPTQPPTALPIDDDTSAVLHKGTLLLTLGGRVVEYALVPGQPATEVRRADLPAQVFDAPVMGGFVVLGAVALDLEDALKPYDVIDAGGVGCTISVNAQDHSASWFLVPGMIPDRRFTLENLPEFECGPRSSRFEGATAVAAEPAGERFLVKSDVGLSEFDPVTGDHTDGLALEGQPAWVGAHLVGVNATGTAANMPLGVTLTALPEEDLSAEPARFEHPTGLVSWTTDADAVYLLVEGKGRAFGTDPPAPKTHQLLRFDPAVGAPVAMALPAKVAPEAIAVGGGRLWLFDASRQAIALAMDGTEQLRVELPLGHAAISGTATGNAPHTFVASELGVFFEDACGGLSLATPTGELATYSGAATWHIVAADATRVFGLGLDTPHPGLPGAPRFATLTPTLPGDGTLGFSAAAQWPVPALAGAATAGVRLALAVGRLFVLQPE